MLVNLSEQTVISDVVFGDVPSHRLFSPNYQQVGIPDYAAGEVALRLAGFLLPMLNPDDRGATVRLSHRAAARGEFDQSAERVLPATLVAPPTVFGGRPALMGDSEQEVSWSELRFPTVPNASGRLYNRGVRAESRLRHTVGLRMTRSISRTWRSEMKNAALYATVVVGPIGLNGAWPGIRLSLSVAEGCALLPTLFHIHRDAARPAVVVESLRRLDHIARTGTDPVLVERVHPIDALAADQGSRNADMPVDIDDLLPVRGPGRV